VIGVNTAIFTNTGTSAGVGFAIPIDIVRSVVPQLIQYGKVVRPALNIQVGLLHFFSLLLLLPELCETAQKKSKVWQADRQAGRQTDRQTHGQTDRLMHTV
jgi:S1-C subfamily serine protease